MEEVEKLKPCPFCGSAAWVHASGDGSGVMIECMTPDCVQPHVSYYGQGVAASVWNRRAALASSPQEEVLERQDCTHPACPLKAGDCATAWGRTAPFTDCPSMSSDAPAEESAVYPEWRPIETAPRDGTRLIGLLTSGRAVTIASHKHHAGWVQKPDGGFLPNGEFIDVWSEEEAGAVVPRKPTHWMPFPTTPKAEAE